MKLFEEGVELTGSLSKALDEAQSKITVLTEIFWQQLTPLLRTTAAVRIRSFGPPENRVKRLPTAAWTATVKKHAMWPRRFIT